MSRTLLAAVAGLLAAIVLFALADLFAEAAGGTTHAFFAALAALLLCAGAGARCASRAAVGAPVALWLALCGWLVGLPGVAASTSGLLAGPPRSVATVLAALFAALLAGRPVALLGAHLSARVEAAGAAGWNALLFGALSGIVLVQRTGLGFLGWLLACVGVLLVMRVRFPEITREDVGCPRADRRQLLPAFLAAGSTVCGLLFLLPLLGVFDGGSAPQNASRWLALGVCAFVAAITLGAALSQIRFDGPGCAILAVGLAYGWALVTRRMDSLADGEIFNALVGSRPLLELLGQPEQRLIEGDWAYEAVLAVAVGSLPLVMLGALTRAVLEMPERDDRKTARGASLAAWFGGAGTALLVAGSLGHPELTSHRGALAFWAALGCAAACVLADRAIRARAVRVVLAAIVIGVPSFVIGAPAQPLTGMPFYDNFTYHVSTRDEDRAERLAPGSVVRVIGRGGPVGANDWFPTDGRNSIAGEPDAVDAQRLEALFPLALHERVDRALLVGSLEADTVRTLGSAGVAEIHAAVEPLELLEVARAFDPAWRGLELTGAVTTAAEADGPFDLVLLRDAGQWAPSRFAFRAATIRSCARRLGEDGILAIGMDLERATPELLGAIARALDASCEETALWLLPRAWRTPRLLFTGSRAPLDGLPGLEHDAVRFSLVAAGLGPLEAADVPLLRVAEGDALSALRRGTLRSPLPRLVPALAETKYLRVDEIRPTLRAAGVLAAVRQDLGERAVDSLLDFYVHHLWSQQYSVHDTYLLAPESEWLDVDVGSLERLFALTQRHRDSRLLQTVWAELGALIVAKREIDWLFTWFGALTATGPVEAGAFGSVEGLGWQSPRFSFLLGYGYVEILNGERALLMADRVVASWPDDPDGHALRGQALDLLERHAESAAAYAEAVRTSRAAPAAALLRGWAEAELAAGRPEEAMRIARDLFDRDGAAAVGRELLALLGETDDADAHRPSAPEHSGDGD